MTSSTSKMFCVPGNVECMFAGVGCHRCNFTPMKIEPTSSSTSNGDGLFYESDGLYADYTYDGNDNRVAIVRADALDALVSGRDRLQRDADYFAEGGVSAIERLRAAEAERRTNP